MQEGLQGNMKKITDDFYVDKSKALGKGNFGTVFKGYHLSFHRIIAVKFVDKKILSKFPDYERQITVMQDLSKIYHPHIMGYYGYENGPDGLYCFIEFCNGGNLKDLSKAGISQLRVLKLLDQLLDAMTYINEQNKVHRDLKPENILLDQNQELKIADFGLARDVQTKMTKGVCTPLYAAPQVLKLDPYNEKCDVWSAGLILYQMITSKQMFQHVKKKNELMKQVQSFADPKKKVKIPENYNPIWHTIILKMLTHDMKKRPTFKELKAYFDQIKPKLQEELLAKYGQQKNRLDEEANQLRLTKSINPYHSKNMKVGGGLAEMAKKLEQQNSFTKFNNLRKWLHFSRQRAQVMVKLIKQFNKCQYAYIKNVHKYILMFLSVAAYISRIQGLQKEVGAKRVQTPDGVVTEKDICSTHSTEYQQLIKETANKFDSSITKYKGVLENQIIVKIMGTYMKREEQRKIIGDFKNLNKFLEDAQKGTYHNQKQYSSLYNQLIDMNGLKYTNAVLKEFKYEDLKVYSYIRIIGHIDVTFDKTSYRSEDYLRAKKQQIENANMEQLITLLKPIN